MTLSDVLVDSGLASAKSDARRLCAQGAIRMNGLSVMDSEEEITGARNIMVGKRLLEIREVDGGYTWKRKDESIAGGMINVSR